MTRDDRLTRPQVRLLRALAARARPVEMEEQATRGALERRGLIRQAPDAGGGRRHYEVTEAGREALRDAEDSTRERP